tara:strand:- start:563 stop:1945 length:1383 start_codon:yes stop_codon:yes gene_type:complete
MKDKVVWKPHAGQQTFALQVDAFEVLFGGARGGGKTMAGMAWLVHPDYITNPSYRALVVRRNYDDLRDWIDRARFFYRTMGVQVTGNPAEFRFPSGAKFRTGHLSEDQAYTKYLGHEYSSILIEELTLIPTEMDYLRLISSCRSSSKSLKPRIFLTTNPGNIGHAWVKDRFIECGRNKIVKDKDSGRTKIFIPSKIEDNPTLVDTDPDYVNYLKSLPEEMRKMWYEGDWDVYEGQFFTRFRQEKHVIEPFEIPESWYKYRMIDYGFRNYFVCLWVAVDNDRNVYVYREHAEKETELNRHIAKINELSGDEEYMSTICDPSMWIRNPQNTNRSDGVMPSHMSIADIMLVNGIPCQRANNDRASGWNVVREYLDWNEKEGKEPMLKIFPQCKYLIKTFPMQTYSNTRPEDLNTHGEDHAVDSLRYGLMHLGSPNEPEKPKPWLQKELDKLKQLDDDYSGVRN